MKNIAMAPLRILFVLPLILLAYLFDGLHKLFERLSDGFFDAASSMRQVTMLPYVKELKKAQEDASARDLAILLKGLE